MDQHRPGFKNIQLIRGHLQAPVYDGTNRPHPLVGTIEGVAATCNRCGAELNAHKGRGGAIPGTFFIFGGGTVQITCGECEQQFMFNQSEYP